jgi:hypothetical protein
MMRAVVWIALGLMAVGLVSGALFALMPALLGRDLPGAVDLVMTLYDGLAVLMPGALWGALYARRDDADYRPAYATLARAVATSLQGAALGSLLGAGPLFLSAASTVAASIGGLDPDAFDALLRARVLWSGLLFVAAVATGSAIPLGIWTYFTGPGRNDES